MRFSFVVLSPPGFDLALVSWTKRELGKGFHRAGFLPDQLRNEMGFVVSQTSIKLIPHSITLSKWEWG
jgi:hypothetical protein